MAKVPDRQTHRVLGSDSRLRLLDELRRSDHPLTVEEASDAIGLHTNTTRFHLEQLVSVGLAERVTEQRTTPGRPRTLYRPVEPTDRSADGDYRALAGLLADGLAATADPAQAAVNAGERWAAALGQRLPVPEDGQTTSPEAVAAELRQLLDELGFEPELDLSHGQIRLHRCPFADVAKDNRTVVCGVHLGMLRASLRQLGAPEATVELQSFVTESPLLCLVHLDLAPAPTPEPATRRTRSGRRVS